MNTQIIPDITVKIIDGKYTIKINDESIPLLKINYNYAKLMKSNKRLPESTKKFLENKFKSAMLFVKGIEQRKRNIYKFTEALVELQKEFLEHGVTHLKPLVFKEIADKIGVHESTISRIIIL